jgi:hypothetical protein
MVKKEPADDVDAPRTCGEEEEVALFWVGGVGEEGGVVF